MFKASAFREKDDAEPSATGHAFEERTQGYVNKTSYIENCETSAVGRALALLGYEISKGIASREEMAKVQRYNDDSKTTAAKPNGMGDKLTAEKRRAEILTEIKRLAAEKQVELDKIAFGTTNRTNNIDSLNLAEAEKALEFLKRK